MKKRKKLLSLLSICFLSSTALFAQGHFGGHKSIAINYLGIDKGSGANLNYQQLVGNNYFGYRLDLDYMKKDHNLTVLDYTYKSKLERYSLGSALTYSFENWIEFPFYLQAFIGASYGKEKINNDKNEIDRIPYDKPSSNVLGAYAGFELEVSFHKRFSFAIMAKNTFSNSEIKKSLFNYGVGFKYSLNY